MAEIKIIRAYLLAGIFWILSIVFALKIGAVGHADLDLILQLRVPRVLLSSAIGMGLAIGGVALQSLFSNPLCEPYTLGVSSGAALGAVIGTAFGLEWNFAGLMGSAFLGALIFAGVLYFVSFYFKSASLTLLLAGVMLGFLGSSLLALLLAFLDSNGIQSALFWLLGDLSRARMQGAVLSWILVAFISLAIWTRWRELDALLMGEEGALALGIDVRKTQKRFVFLVSLLVGICVSGAGMIGFVGLVIPHLARRWVGSLHLKLIPFCGILGSAMLVFADGIARWVIQPYELPVGVITALIGAPFFLWIILYGYRRREIL